MSDAPWTFGEARRKCHDAAQLQAGIEDDLKAAYRDAAQKEEAYRKALAARELELRAENIAWSTVPDLARGDPHVAHLRMMFRVAEGVVAATQQAAFRRGADRKDAERFADWSQRRELAEGAGRVPIETGPLIGGRS